MLLFPSGTTPARPGGQPQSQAGPGALRPQISPPGWDCALEATSSLSTGGGVLRPQRPANGSNRSPRAELLSPSLTHSKPQKSRSALAGREPTELPAATALQLRL
ncbi:hypothetical protein KIL84_015624 [Mauremys mutica]|uniref:Uncharacterized protein n=1 Tax=Mauremys mutica TaxID=74926 RepID=A0A9D4AM82_9SAUR|nr:hypothetical protein KIL84_015624 [Mauremys mutica]